MSSLRDIQSSFADYLSANASAEPGATSGPSTHLFGTLKPTLVENISLYRNNVRHAHVTALSVIFPATRALVGEDYFDGISNEFTSRFHPQSSILALYGAGLPAFIGHRTELSGFPYIADLARFEWLINDSFHAPDAMSMDVAEAAAFFDAAEDDIALKTLPSLRLLTSDFQIDDIHSAALLGNVDALQNLKPGSRHLLVFRPHGDVKIEKLTPEELVFLSALSAHTSLEITLANVCSKYPDFDPTAALGRLLHLGVFQMPPH